MLHKCLLINLESLGKYNANIDSSLLNPVNSYIYGMKFSSVINYEVVREFSLNLSYLIYLTNRQPIPKNKTFPRTLKGFTSYILK